MHGSANVFHHASQGLSHGQENFVFVVDAFSDKGKEFL
jgi:hypothetical protein